MNKDQFQKELKEKLKLGIKPSDLKSPQAKNSQIPTPPASPIVVPIKTIRDQAYDKIIAKDQIKQLQEKANYWANTANTYLANLQKTMAQLDQAELIIQELQAENQTLNKTIANLKTQNKTPEKTNPEEIKTFLCSDCQQTQPLSQLSRQFNNFSFCRACSAKARKAVQEKPQSFACYTCQQTKAEIPNKIKLDQSLKAYSVCSTCRPNLKEFNEADLITDELWIKYPYSSASEILEKEFNIKKEEPW